MINNRGSIFSTKGLTFRMAFYVVAAALIIGLALSVFQIFLDYKEEKQEISSKFEELITSFKPVAEVAIYEVDAKFTKQVALGLLKHEAIVRVTISDELAGDLIDVSQTIPDSNLQWLTGLLFGDLVQKTLPLYDLKRKNVKTGELLIVLNPNYFTSDFLHRAGLILVSGFIRNIILALITFYLFYHLLTKPLHVMAKEINALDSDSVEEKKLKVPFGHENDELGELVFSFNNMDTSLKNAQLKLKSYNKELEQKVKERTSELVDANKLLKHEVDKRKKSEELLRVLSHFDSLTGLYNRYYFEEEVNRLQNGRHYPLGIIVCDVDGLKLVNDELGHDVGDKHIQRAADIIKSAFRESDMVARIGGDEFAVLLPDSDQDTLQASAQRIREISDVDQDKHPGLPISISIGEAICTEPPLDIKALFKEADKRMYQDKADHKESYRQALLSSIGH